MKGGKLFRLGVLVCGAMASARAAEPPASPALEPAPATTGALLNPRVPLYELVPQISVISPHDFSLTSERYVARYSEALYGLPAVFVGLSSRVGYTGRLEYFLQARVGFATKGGNVPVSELGAGGEALASKNEPVRLHWLPFSVSAKALYSLPSFTFLRPSLTVSLGNNFIFQSGNLPGFGSTFVVPFYTITPGLTFLDGNRGQDWFGGFSFGFSFMGTFLSNQKLAGTSVDLSVNILL